jgi:hypothetical protein
MVGALIRKFWLDKYIPLDMVPVGDRKLATTWADYQAAEGVGFPTAAGCDHQVLGKTYFLSFIHSDDPNVLTHDSHNCFMHDLSPFIM